MEAKEKFLSFLLYSWVRQFLSPFHPYGLPSISVRECSPYIIPSQYFSYLIFLHLQPSYLLCLLFIQDINTFKSNPLFTLSLVLPQSFFPSLLRQLLYYDSYFSPPIHYSNHFDFSSASRKFLQLLTIRQLRTSSPNPVHTIGLATASFSELFLTYWLLPSPHVSPDLWLIFIFFMGFSWLPPLSLNIAVLQGPFLSLSLTSPLLTSPFSTPLLLLPHSLFRLFSFLSFLHIVLFSRMSPFPRFQLPPLFRWPFPLKSISICPQYTPKIPDSWSQPIRTVPLGCAHV